MEGGIYCTYGYFGTYKTLGNVALIKKKLDKGEIVFSNIKLNGNYFNNFDNYFYFDDLTVLHDVLAFSGIFARKVSEYNEIQWSLGLPSFDRSQRPKISIVFDELAVFADSSQYKEFSIKIGKDLAKYLVQIRKLGVELYMIIQKPNKLVKELRQYVEYWIKPEPKFSFFKKYIIKYDLVSLNMDTFKIETELKYYMNSDGQLLSYDKEIRQNFLNIWYTPFYFNFYDDTFINLDIDKIYFKTDYLKNVGLLNRIFSNSINHKILVDNVKIYEPYKNVLYNSDVDFKISRYDFKDRSKISFFDNPFYYYYLFLQTLKYYGRNPFKSLKIFFMFLFQKMKKTEKKA